MVAIRSLYISTLCLGLTQALDIGLLNSLRRLAIRDGLDADLGIVNITIGGDSPSQGLPPPTRHITDTDDDGNSYFFNGTSTAVKTSSDLGEGATLALGYNTVKAAPISLTDGEDLDMYMQAINNPPALVTTNGGSNLWFVDTPPGVVSELHRTQSIDFSVQIHGELELTMSNGETRLIKPGDVVIQRGTLHKWRNPSKTQWSRFVGINTGSDPIVTKNNGTLAQVL